MSATCDISSKIRNINVNPIELDSRGFGVLCGFIGICGEGIWLDL